MDSLLSLCRLLGTVLDLFNCVDDMSSVDGKEIVVSLKGRLGLFPPFGIDVVADRFNFGSDTPPRL